MIALMLAVRKLGVMLAMGRVADQNHQVADQLASLVRAEELRAPPDPPDRGRRSTILDVIRQSAGEPPDPLLRAHREANERLEEHWRRARARYQDELCVSALEAFDRGVESGLQPESKELREALSDPNETQLTLMPPLYESIATDARNRSRLFPRRKAS